MRKRVSINFYENYVRFMFYLFISSGDHTEVISIDFDPNRISYEQLLDLFWNNHEYGLTKRIKRQVNEAKNSSDREIRFVHSHMTFFSCLVHVIDFSTFG